MASQRGEGDAVVTEGWQGTRGRMMVLGNELGGRRGGGDVSARRERGQASPTSSGIVLTLPLPLHSHDYFPRRDFGNHGTPFSPLPFDDPRRI